MNVYIGSNSRLPSGYQEVEYIESSGTQWINTGYTPTVNTEIETDISWSASQPGTWACFFGVTGNDTSGNGVLARIYNSSSTTFNPRFCNSTYGEAQITVTTDTFHNITLKKNGGSVDGTAYTLTTSGTPYQSAIYLFDANNSGAAWNRRTICKIKTFKISESGVLQRDLVPCYRKSDSVIGLYDLVNDSFYTNSGSGTFTKGADVYTNVLQNAYIGEYKGRLPSAYQEVEYIESTRTQKISTGFNVKSTMKVQTDFMITRIASSSDSEVLFGTTYGSWSWASALVFYHTGVGFQVADRVQYGGFSLGNRYTLEWTPTYSKLDGEQKNFSAGTSSYEVTLFYGNNNGGYTRIYTFKIYDGTTLVRDFVPCYRKSDSVIGMYDLVNDTFYTNSGSGTFTKGPDVN